MKLIKNKLCFFKLRYTLLETTSRHPPIEIDPSLIQYMSQIPVKTKLDLDEIYLINLGKMNYIFHHFYYVSLKNVNKLSCHQKGGGECCDSAHDIPAILFWVLIA